LGKYGSRMLVFMEVIEKKANILEFEDGNCYFYQIIHYKLKYNYDTMTSWKEFI